MSNLPSKIIMAKLHNWYTEAAVSRPSNSNIALQNVFSLDYTTKSSIVRAWVDDLTVYTHADMGTSDNSLNVNLSSNVTDYFFVANINTTPEYLLCYSEDFKKIDTTIWIKGYTE